MVTENRGNACSDGHCGEDDPIRQWDCHNNDQCSCATHMILRTVEYSTKHAYGCKCALCCQKAEEVKDGADWAMKFKAMHDMHIHRLPTGALIHCLPCPSCPLCCCNTLGHERKLSPKEWLNTSEFSVITLVDYDGWTFDEWEEQTPITRKEFKTRLNKCTIQV